MGKERNNAAWNAAAVEAALSAQGIVLAPGRAERLAHAVEGFLAPSMADPLRDAVEFERDPEGFAAALPALRAR